MEKPERLGPKREQCKFAILWIVNVTCALFLRGPTPGGFGLLLLFADGSRLSLLPYPTPESPQDEALPSVADWELFTPYGMYLKVGPGPKWAYLPSRSEKDASANSGRQKPSGEFGTD